MPVPLGVSPNIFIFGDSLTKYLVDDCADIGGCNVTLLCQRGGTVLSIRESILSISNNLQSASPDIIFLHVGTNDLSYFLVERIIANYRDLLTTVGDIFSNTQILVNNIFRQVTVRP